MIARLLGRAVGGVVLATLLVVSVPVPVPAGVPPPAESSAYCARLVALRDSVGAVRTLSSGPDVFAAIRKVAREFRRVAADAPNPIADDMAVLATSFTELERALRPLATKVRPAVSQADYDRMVARIQRTYTEWQDAQDPQAIADAQDAVDGWTEGACGFRLSPGDSSSSTSSTIRGTVEVAPQPPGQSSVAPARQPRS